MADKRTVHVTPAQVAAAQLRVKLDGKLGRETPPAVVSIANAKRRDPGRRRWTDRIPTQDAGFLACCLAAGAVGSAAVQLATAAYRGAKARTP
jgi:hypothetical protein